MGQRDDLSKQLNEHYAYELLMLRYTIKRLDTEDNQMEWNALFESCLVHARNLRDFLTNGGYGRDLRAQDFGVTIITVPEELKGVFWSINKQIQHLDKKRPAEATDGKLTLEAVRRAVEWVEEQHRVFINSCHSDIRARWTEPLHDGEALATLPSALTTSSSRLGTVELAPGSSGARAGYANPKVNDWTPEESDE